MGLGIMICFRLKVETLIIPFRLIPLFLCFNLVQSPIGNYLLYFLQSQALKEYVAIKSAGSTVSHLRVGQVFDIPIIYPSSISEQKEIADLCSRYTEEIDYGCKFIQNDIEL
jgi:restriction endonuclease S subunit